MRGVRHDFTKTLDLKGLKVIQRLVTSSNLWRIKKAYYGVYEQLFSFYRVEKAKKESKKEAIDG